MPLASSGGGRPSVGNAARAFLDRRVSSFSLIGALDSRRTPSAVCPPRHALKGMLCCGGAGAASPMPLAALGAFALASPFLTCVAGDASGGVVAGGAAFSGGAAFLPFLPPARLVSPSSARSRMRASASTSAAKVFAKMPAVLARESRSFICSSDEPLGMPPARRLELSPAATLPSVSARATKCSPMRPINVCMNSFIPGTLAYLPQQPRRGPGGVSTPAEGGWWRGGGAHGECVVGLGSAWW